MTPFCLPVTWKFGNWFRWKFSEVLGVTAAQNKISMTKATVKEEKVQTYKKLEA